MLEFNYLRMQLDKSIINLLIQGLDLTRTWLQLNHFICKVYRHICGIKSPKHYIIFFWCFWVNVNFRKTSPNIATRQYSLKSFIMMLP